MKNYSIYTQYIPLSYNLVAHHIFKEGKITTAICDQPQLRIVIGQKVVDYFL